MENEGREFEEVSEKRREERVIHTPPSIVVNGDADALTSLYVNAVLLSSFAPPSINNMRGVAVVE